MYSVQCTIYIKYINKLLSFNSNISQLFNSKTKREKKRMREHEHNPLPEKRSSSEPW